MVSTIILLVGSVILLVSTITRFRATPEGVFKPKLTDWSFTLSTPSVE